MMVFNVCVNDTVQLDELSWGRADYDELLLIMCLSLRLWWLAVSVLQLNKTDIKSSKGQ